MKLAEPPAVQPDRAAVVHALEAHLPEPLHVLRRLGQRELLAVPADASRGSRVRSVAFQLLGTRTGLQPARSRWAIPALRLADEQVVLAEVPAAAEQQPPVLALADQHALGGRLHLERRRGLVGRPGSGAPTCARAAPGSAAVSASRARVDERRARTAEEAAPERSVRRSRTRRLRRASGSGCLLLP